MRNPVYPALALLLGLSGAAASASGGGEGSGGLHLIAMDDVSVPIVDGNRTDGSLRFKLVLEARDEAAAQAVTATLPILRAASLQAGIEFARLYASPMLPVDARRLASDLSAALRTQNAGISRVLLVEVEAQPA